MKQELRYNIDHISVDIITDICALLNTDGGTIVINSNSDDKNHDAIEKQLKDSLHYLYKYDHSRVVEVDLSHYVDIRKENKNGIDSAIIDIKPFREVGTFIIFPDFNCFFYYLSKKVKIELDDFNTPFINQMIKDGDCILRGFHELPLYDGFSYTQNIKEIKRKNNVSVYWTGEANIYDYLYKYMSLDSVRLCLNDRDICFNQPSCWDDQYEKRFYDAKYIQRDRTVTPRLYACCFTTKQDNEAAWYIYSHSKSSENSKVIEFKLDFRKLYEQLILNLSNCDVYIGSVKYLSQFIIDNIHEPKVTIEQHGRDKEIDNPYYYQYFDNFTRDSYLSLLLLKRDAFEHENEIRFFIVPKSCEAIKDHNLVNINWIDIIEQVRIDAKCTTDERNEIAEKLNHLLFRKKDDFLEGLNNINVEEVKDYLSNTFVHSDWDNHTTQDFEMSIDARIKEYFINLENKIKPLVFDIYSSNLSNGSTLIISE